MKTYIITTLLLLTTLMLSAQPNKKIAPALSNFLNTEFMLKFNDLKIDAESSAAGILAREAQIKPADMVRIRTAYNQTAQRANKMIEVIKQDFLDAKKLKSIDAMPDMYSDGLKLRLAELSEFYSSHYKQALMDATGEQLAGSPLLFLVSEMISLTKGLTTYFRQMHREARLYTEDHLNQHLIKPHRWRYWNEIVAGDGAADHYSDYIQYNQTPTQNTMTPDMPTLNYDQWNNQLNKNNYNPNNPYNNYNQNPYNPTPNPYDPNAANNGNYNPNNPNQSSTPPPNTNTPPPTWNNPDPNANNPNPYGVGNTTPPVDSFLAPVDTTKSGRGGDPFQYPDNNQLNGKKKQTPYGPGKTPNVDPKTGLPIKKEDQPLKNNQQ
jgi:hypothetical protein